MIRVDDETKVFVAGVFAGMLLAFVFVALGVMLA